MSRYSSDILNDSKKLGITESILDKYYNRGMLAWIDHKNDIPGITPEELGIVVVEEFLKTEKAKKFTIREDIKELAQPEAPKHFPKKKRFDEEFVAALPKKEIIRKWATSKEIQESYLKRYADKAEFKLIEAANLFNQKPAKLEEISNSKPGTKRHSWDMKTYHEKMMKESKTEKDIIFHKEKAEKYTKKMNNGK